MRDLVYLYCEPLNSKGMPLVEGPLISYHISFEPIRYESSYPDCVRFSFNSLRRRVEGKSRESVKLKSETRGHYLSGHLGPQTFPSFQRNCKGLNQARTSLDLSLHSSFSPVRPLPWGWGPAREKHYNLDLQKYRHTYFSSLVL